jgi:antitoxin component HigA of HigAB toxin-antitoxin module
MASSVPSRTSSMPLQSLDLQMAKASIDVHSPESAAQPSASADAVSLVVDTLRQIGMSDKEACYCMGFDPSQFSRVKEGRARLPLDALWRLPDRFWFAFRDRVDAARGLTRDNAKRIRAARIGELVSLLVEAAS